MSQVRWKNRKFRVKKFIEQTDCRNVVDWKLHLWPNTGAWRDAGDANVKLRAFIIWL